MNAKHLERMMKGTDAIAAENVLNEWDNYSDGESIPKEIEPLIYKAFEYAYKQGCLMGYYSATEYVVRSKGIDVEEMI